MLLPSALGFSPHPPVSVYGTGYVYAIVAFLGSHILCFATYVRSPLRDRIFLFRLTRCACVPTVLIYISAGISTCCPSTTPFGLALGPDFPRADQLYPGILGYSAWRILTSISLLIPAFSLQSTPLLLIGTASSRFQCSSTNLAVPKLRCRVLAPDIFGAGPLD